MTKFNTKSLLIIVVILLIGITALWQIQRRASPAAAWFSDAWQYRKAVDIGNSSTATTNQYIKITLDTASLISAGKMQNTCNDIRVTNIRGKVLTHFIDGNTDYDCNENDTSIYVLADSIPSSGSTVYVYYGNSSASNIEPTLGTNQNPGLSCKNIFEHRNDNKGDNQYYITPTGNLSDKIQVSCNMTEKGGGYILIWHGLPSEAMVLDTTNESVNLSNNIVFNNMYMKGVNLNWGVTTTTTETAKLSKSIPQYFYEVDQASDATNPKVNFHDLNNNQDVLLTNSDYFMFGYGNSWRVFYTCINVSGINNLYLGGYSPQCVPRSSFNGDSVGCTTGGNYCSNARTTTPKDSGLGLSLYEYQETKVYVRENTITLNINQTAATPGVEELSPAPIAYWSFDEGVGTSAFDNSSNQNHGVINGATWQTEEQCISGKCLNFDNIDDQVVAPYINFKNTFTASMWIKANSFSAGDDGLIDQYESSNINKRLHLVVRNSKLYLGFWGNDLASDTILSTNKWYFITFQHDGTQQKIYINGVLDKTKNASSYEGNSGLTYIGKKTSDNSSTFDGLIDEVKVYAYARTAAQIKQDYRAGLAGMKTQKGSSVAMGGSSGGKSLSDGLVGYWKMDEGVGTTTADSSGNNNTGTFGAGSSAPGWTSGKFGIGTSYNGVGTYTTLATSVIMGGSGSAISMWFKPIAFGGMLVGKFGDNDTYVLLENSTNIAVQTDTGNTRRNYTVPAMSLGNWYHLIVTRNNNITKVYLNGIESTSGGQSQTPDLTITQFGRYSNYNDNWYNGLIDEVRIYNRALSPAEVTVLYEYAPGPVAYYDFEEGVGTTAFDKSGNGNNAVWSSNNYTTGKIGKAGNFTSSNYVTLKNIDSLDIVGPITISAWVYPTTMNAANIIFSRGGGSANNCQYLLNIESGSPRFYMGNTNDLKSASAPTILTNKWHYLTGIFDGTKTYIYVNGVGISGGSITNQTHNTSYASRIGAYSHAGTYPFAGQIDEVKIYNYARTQKQILQDMNASAPVGGMSKINKPIAWYKFDEGYGTVANNSGSIGSTLNGTFGPGTSAPTWVTGKSGKGLSFDGNDYIDYGNPPSLNTSLISVSAWIKPSTVSGGEFAPIAKATGGGDMSWEIYQNNSNIQFFVNNNTTYGYASANSALATNKWVHVVGTWDGTIIKIYVDGILKGQTSFVGTLKQTAFNVYVGRRTDGLFFTGSIDEVKIYNYALSEDEIKQDYNQGATAVIGKSTQTIGATTTSLDYCIPGDTSHCAPPIAEYNFEEGVGTTAYDKSGNGNHCYTSNSPLWVSGKTGGALQFNGSNQRCTKTGGVTIGQITAQAWVYRTSSTTNQGIIRQQNSFILSLKDDTIQLGGTSFLNTGITIPLNSWQHVAWTNNGNNNILFINGQEKWRNSGGTLPNNTNDLNVAYDNNNWWWGGKIDSVKIYNYARTPAQIAYDYNKGAPIAHWKMDECQGTTINDSSGNNNHGTLTIGVGGSQSSVGTCQSSGAWYNGRTGKINSAMSFDGTDDYVGGSFSGGSTFTFSAWVKNNNISFNGFVGYTDSSGRRREIYLSDAGRLRIFYGLNKFKESISNSLMNDLAWHHVVGTYDDSSAKIYIDGKETSLGNELTTSTQSANIFYIGRLLSGSNYFNGLIDDVRIYNYALTAEQVKSVYNGGSINFR